jgi:hypothetical protein
MSEPTHLYWHCAACGAHETAQPEYTHGASEPCVSCETGVARVMTISEAAQVEQRRALTTKAVQP